MKLHYSHAILLLTAVVAALPHGLPFGSGSGLQARDGATKGSSDLLQKRGPGTETPVTVEQFSISYGLNHPGQATLKEITGRSTDREVREFFTHARVGDQIYMGLQNQKSCTVKLDLSKKLVRPPSARWIHDRYAFEIHCGGQLRAEGSIRFAGVNQNRGEIDRVVEYVASPSSNSPSPPPPRVQNPHPLTVTGPPNPPSPDGTIPRISKPQHRPDDLLKKHWPESAGHPGMAEVKKSKHSSLTGALGRA